MGALSPYITKQAGVVLPYLDRAKSVLDYGCGDTSLLQAIHKAKPTLSLTGIDVADAGVRPSGIAIFMYDGQHLPFKDRSFDATIVYHVFHHTPDPRRAFTEALRVTRKRIIIVEPVFRHGIDLFFMKLLDRVGNGWRNVRIAMPFTFQKEATWRTWAREMGWGVRVQKPAGIFPSWAPIGKTMLFVLEPEASPKLRNHKKA